MNIKEVKDLIQDILHSDISEFELEHTGTKVKLRRGFAQGDPPPASSAPALAKPAVAGHESNPSLAGSFAASAVSKDEVALEEGLHVITSPIVGTFYRASAPGAEPYVEIGSKIEGGTILCIVEAMKLMNEITSDVAGEVIKVYVENGQPVEYGQKLFGIQPRK
jgi:acetyl-CoA carboxylase biotin carboxyl carrier protein